MDNDQKICVDTLLVGQSEDSIDTYSICKYVLSQAASIRPAVLMVFIMGLNVLYLIGLSLKAECDGMIGPLSIFDLMSDRRSTSDLN